MNLVIGGAVGLVLGLFGVIGGVSAYIGSPDVVAQGSLYNYSDN